MAATDLDNERTLDDLAYEIWEKAGRPPTDGLEEWIQAEKLVLIHKRVRVTTVAEEMWERGGRLFGNALADWLAAQRVVAWEEWARAKLLPYLAIGCIRQPHVLGERLANGPNATNATNAGDKANVVSLIAVLDGSPEHSRHVYHSSNGKLPCPEDLVERKDAEFLRYCDDVFPKYGGRFVDREHGSPSNGVSHRPRRYQDGCLVEFDGPSPIRALQAAIHLRRTLTDENELKNRPWNLRLHARTVIGAAFRDTARCLETTRRDEISVTSNVLGRLAASERELLAADNVRQSP